MMRQEELERQIRGERAAALVVNPGSRNGKKLLQRGAAALARRGITVTATYAAGNQRQLRAMVESLIDRCCRLIVVAGGDGTVSAVAGAFAYRDAVLGLLPVGTGNSFARTLGIPLALSAAVEVIVHGRVTTIDLGRVGDDYFANAATIGMTAATARGAPGLLKRWCGPLAYVLTGAYTLARHRRFRCRMRTGELEVAFATREVIVANGSFFGNQLLTGLAILTDHRLVACTLSPLSRWRTALLWGRFFLRGRIPPGQMQCTLGQEFFIDADPAQAIDLDGEIVGTTPARFTVAPGALHVLVPG